MRGGISTSICRKPLAHRSRVRLLRLSASPRFETLQMKVRESEDYPREIGKVGKPAPAL
jgi:hypothetical protein